MARSATNRRITKNYLIKLATASLCLVVFPVWGDDTIPQSLPTGSGLLDLAVANNPCSLTVILQNTNSKGGLNTCGFSTKAVSFGSYAALQSFIATKSFSLFNFLKKQNGSDVRFVMNATYAIDAPCPQLSIDVDLGPTAGITAGSFYVAPIFQSVALNMAGVTSANIQFGNYPSNSLAITSRGIVLNGSCLNNNGERMRLSLTMENGETATYTQSGSLIAPPSISMFWLPSPPAYSYDDYDYYDGSDGYGDTTYWEWYFQYGGFFDWWFGYGYPTSNSYNVLVSGAYGADTEIDSTTDFITWTPIATMPWDSGSTQMIMPVASGASQPGASPMMFFRAKSF